MKIFRFFAIALVAMLGLSACNNDCDHDFIEYDYSEALIGTWTYVADNGQAEAMVINPDGSFEVTGIMKGGNLYEEKGTIEVVNNKVSLIFDGDTDVIEGRLELVAGKSLSIVINDEYDIRLTYDYCENDLSDEIVGMWVCNDFTTNGDADMMIETFYENGKSTLTGLLPMDDNYEQILNGSTDYQVVGDLLFITIPAEKVDGKNPLYVADKLIYTPDGTAHGDILTMITYPKEGGSAATSSWLRVKQHLDLAEKKYDYIKTFISNVKGEDRDVELMGYTFNFAKMDGVFLDKMLKTVLFAVEFPDATTIRYTCHYNQFDLQMDAPIVVDGNKMTIKMQERDSAYHNIDLYTFQDADCSQMHMYMPTSSFIKFFANMQVAFMSELGQLDKNDTAAVDAIYERIDKAVETINVSFVMTKAAK